MAILLKFSPVVFVLLFFCSNTFASYSTEQKQIQSIIIEQANIIGLDPALALAVAKVESDFNQMAISEAGAKGVMQIMPATAEKVFGVPSYLLFDEHVNVKLGVKFLAQLIDKYNQRVDIALSHYNGGSAVRQSDGRLKVIPYTQKYVDKVLRYRKYFNKRVKPENARDKHFIKAMSDTQSLHNKLAVTQQKPRDNQLKQVRQIKRSNKNRMVQLNAEPLLKPETNNTIHHEKFTVMPKFKQQPVNFPIKVVHQQKTPKTLIDRRKQVLEWETIFN